MRTEKQTKINLFRKTEKISEKSQKRKMKDGQK